MSPRRYAFGPIPSMLAGHVEEASFLYEHRRRSCRSSQAPWGFTGALERRMERHLEALRVAGFAAFRATRGFLTDAETAGDAFVAATVALRGDSIEPLEALGNALAEGVPFRGALVDALHLAGDERGLEWRTQFAPAPRPLLRAAAMRAARHEPAMASAIRRGLGDADPHVALEAARAALTLGEAPQVAALERHLDSDDTALAAQALDVLARAGSRAARERIERQCATLPDASLARALRLVHVLGGSGAVTATQRVARERPAHATEALLALGAIGSESALRALEEHVVRPWEGPDDWPRAEAALRALEWASALVFARPRDPDECTPAEAGGLAREWSAAIAAWRDEREPAERWRRGQPLSAGSLATDFAVDGHPDRERTLLELQVAHGSPVSFDVRGPFAHWEQVAHELSEWSGAGASSEPRATRARRAKGRS